MLRLLTLLVAVISLTATIGDAASPEKLAAEQELLKGLQITADQLKPLLLETVIVEDGQPRALICHADDPAWRDAAEFIQQAITGATGVRLEMVTEAELTFEQADAQNVILLGHLDNNRHVARLYHNFFVCLDVGYTGRAGYVIRSVHDPFGTGHNYILVGGSYPEGTGLAGLDLAGKAAYDAQGDSLVLGRQLSLLVEPRGRMEAAYEPLTDEQQDAAIERGRKLMFSPGLGRSGVARVIQHGILYHRTGDPAQLEVYKALMHALLEYYATDEYINAQGLARYDRDFRDAWTYQVGILWDLLEESGAFTDQERLDFTNLCLRLALECVAYQRYDRPDILEHWRNNTDIVHNHNTFPGLGLYFVGNYFKRHYGLEVADDWLTVAHGIFNGQKHASKPLEDAASYQWLPIIHTMAYSLAEGDLTFFEEGHARETARVAMMVMDNAGYQSAFGDHSAYKASSGIPATLEKIAWYCKDPEILWGARLAVKKPNHPLGQPYHVDFEPRAPAEHVGLTVSYLPKMCYDYASHSPAYPTAPNLAWEETFDKLAFRAGLEREDEYLLLDGFGRGTHMHFDANAIIRYSAGGEPLLVDGEYIKNAPKYHNSLVIIRDGQSELTPAVTGLGRAEMLDTVAFTHTWLTEYNGAEWHRHVVWRGNDYFLVSDYIRALREGDYTLRCCWRPWGEASLDGGTLTVEHPPMRMVIQNLDGASCRLERMKVSERLPISRLSQQVSRHMREGDEYCFRNLVCAEPDDAPRDLRARLVREGIVVLARRDGLELIALAEGASDIGKIATAASMLLVAPDRFAVVHCHGLAAAGIWLRPSTPVSLELAPAEGRGVLLAAGETAVELNLPPLGTLTVGDQQVAADQDGTAAFTVGAGRHELIFPPFDMPPRLVAAAARVAAEPASGPRDVGARFDALPLGRTWQHSGFEPPTEVLRVLSAHSDQEHHGRYGPVEKLLDGVPTGSYNSVMWPQGVTATVTAELAEDTEISTVLLREWHMSDTWDIGERKLEISSDGFEQDVRVIEEAFEEIGTQRWGNNVNTLMEVPVDQRGRQIRLTVSPAREDSQVYLAEVEIHGTRPGATPEIRALATGDLTGEGGDEVVVASDSGEVQALTAEGEVLWTFKRDDRGAINALACGDVDGDGRAEVMYGGEGARLGLLSADGKESWHAEPPRFRGIGSDVITILPADVDGDGLPEVICGCKSWQYFAYDADGEMLWRNVIYAHSATVGHADDFDGDGLAEIVGGNAYYRLNLIDNDGERIFSAGNLGPEQTAVSSADVDGDGLPEILVGTDGGELLCFDGDGKRLWAANLGDKITRILPVDLTGDGAPEIACAAESANVFALDRDGNVIWRAPLPDGVTDLAVLAGEGGPLLVAAAGSAGVILLDAKGTVCGRGATEGRAQALALLGSRAVATTSLGIVNAFDLSGQ